MVKFTGIVRPVDKLGRVVLPIELRKNLGIDYGDGLEVYVEGDNIILHKHSPSCVFCGGEGLLSFKGKDVCKDCLHSFRR